MPARCQLLIFLVQIQRYNAARCEGTPNSNVTSHVCQTFLNETACNYSDLTLCLWDSDNGCILKPASSCSLLVDNSEDCNSVDGCYWVEVPAWVWLAINIPIWLLVAGVCLICYHRNIGPSRLDVYYGRSDSMTIDDSGSQFTEEQEAIPDIFRNPFQGACSKDSTESEISSNESSVVEMEEAGAVLEPEVR
mmetsp:Transcript_6390/g.15012  ORF Transcript_6390/g.15012 Transcript_6390/m.15012 type:complete len:192 (-) Transcript_6390:421-996(-)|eukprot:CAMPEP_0113601974 /NCGR_PEP_ID=MMETSP0017_2-20120614/509_1 /TAXON_ID=2856 /ORGANISM="Cylindrotheca closterium" /LENGTH=191 /DNA_ID=CAMNT_0000510291 /DNA_START=32 /DNA_END=607 /DNA_ORIENTATION=- /assembly_acc=CAM_ASM_000147